MVRLKINGREVEVEKDSTVLQAAKKLGIEIPTLCHHDALSPYGSCRLCVVEIRKRGRSGSRIVTSCNYPVEEGLDVETDSDRVLKDRKIVMELLLARCPDVKVLQEMARHMGIEKPRFSLDHSTCILCGLCVRVCEETIGASAISFVSRGVDEDVSTPYDISSDVCIGCGTCARVCPTGAITVETIEDVMRIKKFKRFSTTKKMHQCPSCGKYYIAELHMDWISQRLGPLSFLTSLCPECKRSGSAKIQQRSQVARNMRPS
ncbi:MAG: (2Fe-2S)-binding protein [Deltaproteobacteria bacterium]|nr:(2Fe-2S)-binding protein [Deltaproteobacteria bacterium]